MRKILLALGFCVAASAANATCTSPISSLNSTGSTITLGATVDASNNCWGGTAIVDGTAAANKMAVKAASTAPLAADPAAVVALSPNSVGGVVGTPLFAQITTGAAVIGSISNTSFIATQATAANLNATVVGTGTFAVQLNTTPTIANGNGVVPTQSGIALSAGNPSFAALSIGGSLDSATNGIYSNILQGNTALSATNGTFANILQGNAALATGNPLFVQNTAGSAIIGKVGIDQTTPGTTNGVQVNAALPAGTNVIGHIICDSGCSGSGGTSSTFGSAFPSAGTAIGLTNGTNMVAWSATSNYGTAPSAIPVPAVNANVTNSNPNGSAVSASSSPVVIASDQAAVAVKAASGAFASGSIASGALASGSIASGAAVSGAFVAGAIADLAHGQGAMAASVPVAIASNQSAIPVTPATSDPCTAAAKTNAAISTAIGTTQLVAPSGSTQVYICSIFTIGATASIQNLVGGTGATCTTGTPVAIAGSTTAANGMSFAANGGFTFGNGGGTVMRTTTAGHGVCLIQSATAQISGNITYVQQ